MEDKIKDIIEIIKDHQSEIPNFKNYEDTYMDGWLDACNQILWTVKEYLDDQ